MKRILAVILIMIFMTSAVSYAKISHREQPIQKTEYGYKQAEFLQKLGIIAEIPVLHINVTRGKACEVLAKLILPPKANAAESVFSDVTKDTANVKDIVALYSAGYIKGYGDGRFGPDDMLSYNDASTLLCRVLTADDKGMAEPDGLEIYNGVNAEGSLITYADLYIMTVNVLNTKISENQTFLEEKLNVFKYEGVITDNGITALNGKSNISPAELKINEDVYKWGNVADRTLLGMYVSGYYKCTDEENAKMIITADVEELKNKYISVNSSDVKMITDSEIVFMQDGIERRDSISEDSCFIYNGMSVSQNIIY